MPKKAQFHLVSIRFSHYVEKVRWTLDYLGVPYTETPLMPIVHWAVTPFYISLRGHADPHSTRFSTPILVTDDGKTLSKSSTIMMYLSERFAAGDKQLYPTQEVRELDEHFTNYLGPHTRRLFYYNVLNKPDVIFDLADKNVSAIQASLFKCTYRICKNQIVKGLGVTPEHVEKSIGYIRKEYEAIDKRLSDGRQFLCEDRLTAADISFACLGGSLVLPQPYEGYGAKLPDYSCGCEQLVSLAKEMRASRVGQWVLNLYRNYRGKRLIPGVPAV